MSLQVFGWIVFFGILIFGVPLTPGLLHVVAWLTTGLVVVYSVSGPTEGLSELRELRRRRRVRAAF